MSSFTRFAHVFLAFSALALLSSCSGVNPTAPSATPANKAVQGVVHGGQQPVTGATITLWAAGTTGDGSAATLLTTTTTDANGAFTLAPYTCPGTDPVVYLTAANGNPGLIAGTNNTAILMMAALTDCNTLKANAATTFVFVDEVTTVGSIAALYPYMTSTANLSYGSSDGAAFASAFSSVAEYTNTANGSAPGPTLPTGFYASSTEINTLGNIVASCINSPGGIAGSGSACGNLFDLTKSGSVAPTTTLGAILNILNNPTQNTAALFGLTQPIIPFQPVDSTAPSTWALPILPIAATPTFSIPGGAYSSAQFVTLADTTSGAIIHYTTDGSTPTSSSAIASAAITVSSSETLNAIAQAGGYATSAVASAAYTMSGSTQTYSINGQFNLTTGCGGGSIPPITVTLIQGTTVVQTVTSNTSGSFTFTNVPNDNYTVTPSIAGPASLFYPETQSAAVSGNNVNLSSLSATLGYNVSGTVAYGGSQNGQTYLALNPVSTCGGGGTEGTSILTRGAFTIHGVPPGSYTLQAFMDNIPNGNANASNPSGSISTVVSTANLTGQTVTLTDPTAVTIGSAPTIQGASGFNTGAVVQYNAVTNSSKVETAASYTLQWSTDPAFGTLAGNQTFRANGTKADVWFINGLTDTSVYYFRAYASSAGTPQGPYSNVSGPLTIGAPTGGNTVSGAITFSASPSGPMYVGFLSQTNGNFYAQYIANPASAQPYTIQVPSDSYNFFAILDQNHNGLIDAGDIQNATENGSANATTVISGPQSNLNLTLPSTGASASVTTQYTNSINPGNNFQSYNLNFQVNGLAKLPVAVQLISGPNLINPVDIALCGGPGSTCSRGFQINFGIGATVPSVNDTYSFNVTYSDGTTGIVTATVSAVLNALALPTNLAPQTGTSTSLTPTFTWTDPISPSYTYQFNLCCSGNNTIWQIPGNNSNSNGFSSSITSIPWITSGNDVTGTSNNLPSVSALTLNTIYSWTIQVQDSNGNSAQTQVQYQP